MANPKKPSSEEDLKGTLIATFGVGIIIIIFWVIAFDLYIGRF
ncbi:hypothetical protein ACFPN4_12820 [Ureibacillus thermophilus]|nr:hypothetical protein [Ureibacillus thermophilus]